MKLLALSLLCAVGALAQNAALMPMPRQQFFDSNGAPLAGGLIYTCYAGATCPGNPLSTYTDSTGGVANANPVQLDSGGFAGIWLGNGSYKIVAQSSLGVTQWTVDGVSVIGLSLITGSSPFSQLIVTGTGAFGGNVTVGGNLTVSGTTTVGALTAGAISGSSLAVSGGATVVGAVNSGSSSVAGNETVGGNFTVAATAQVGALNVGAQTLTQFVNALIPVVGAPSSLSGTLAISNIATQTVGSGSWVIFTFGSISGSRVRIAYGQGTGADSTTIGLPTGFSSANLIASAALATVSVSGGNNLDNIAISVSSTGLISAAASDNSGHSYTPTAAWSAVTWKTAY